MAEKIPPTTGTSRSGRGARRATRETRPQIALRRPESVEHIEETRGIFREYAQSLGVDLCFQDFESELAGLPGEYAGPAGHLLLAWVDGRLAGCGALRPLPDADYPNACEMKRLYVRPGFRGLGLGRTLAGALFDEARRIGYSSMLLDTLDDMEAARELYSTLGFEEIPPYYFNPIPGAHYLKAELV
jgi:ribosomal protein S18 acetylase RimI-like enzyme